METRTIFFIGKPGCGKGTQAKLLSEKTGWRVISSGEQFRAIAGEDTPVGHKVKSEIDAGALAPHWFAMYLYLKALFSVSAEEGVIFDGFNRKIPEANLAIDALRWLGRPFTVLEVHVSDEEVRRRITLRKEVEGRADDSAVDERLREYAEYTEPAIDIFRKEGELIEVNGEQTREAIAEDICKALGLAV
jgi:adenylate kinase